MKPSTPLHLMCVFAHPDDETLATGSTLIKYAREGVETSVVCATRGHKGWKLGDYPGPEAVAEHRTEELEQAAACLGVTHLRLLDFMDGGLDQADPREVIRQLVEIMRELKPNVVTTFAPDGAYGHPDHIAISQLTTAAVLQAASQGHKVSKLYYFAETIDVNKTYLEIFGDLKSTVDGIERRFEGWDDWAVTTRLDATETLDTLKEAIYCHRSQLRNYEGLLGLSEAKWRFIFGKPTFYRVFSLVNGGRELETDLFAGLREASHVAA